METLAILREIGFTEIEETTFKWDFGNGKLTAMDCLGLRSGHAVYLSGFVITPRTTTEIDYALPLSVELFEQGLALLACACRHCSPARPTPWLAKGLQLEEHLPWVRQQKEDEARGLASPQCWVPRDWFRLASRALREAAQIASADDRAAFVLDGPGLRIEFGKNVLILPAEGRARPLRVYVDLNRMSGLPKRLMMDPGPLRVLENKLSIAWTSFPLSEASAGGHGPNSMPQSKEIQRDQVILDKIARRAETLLRESAPQQRKREMEWAENRLWEEGLWLGNPPAKACSVSRCQGVADDGAAASTDVPKTALRKILVTTRAGVPSRRPILGRPLFSKSTRSELRFWRGKRCFENVSAVSFCATACAAVQTVSGPGRGPT